MNEQSQINRFFPFTFNQFFFVHGGQIGPDILYNFSQSSQERYNHMRLLLTW